MPMSSPQITRMFGLSVSAMLPPFHSTHSELLGNELFSLRESELRRNERTLLHLGLDPRRRSLVGQHLPAIVAARASRSTPRLAVGLTRPGHPVVRSENPHLW